MIIAQTLPTPDGRHRYLSGRHLEEPLPERVRDNDVLQKNLNLARRISAFVNRHIFFIPNYPRRYQYSPSPEDAMRYISIWFDRDLCQDRMGKTIDKQLDAWFRKHLGQCGEMIFIGFHYFKDRIAQLEPVTIQNGNHCFLVLGRDPTTPLERPSEWNQEAVICDPWTGSCFPASLHAQHLLASTSIGCTEDFYTLVEPWIENATRQLIPCPLDQPSADQIESVRKKYISNPDATPFYDFYDPIPDNFDNRTVIHNPYGPLAPPLQPLLRSPSFPHDTPTPGAFERILTVFRRIKQIVALFLSFLRGALLSH